MNDITLIATIHSENGECNSGELYEIIESINPEVIFDELPRHASDMYYSDSFEMYLANSILLNRHPPAVPLEVNSIRRYKQHHNIKIVPVDIDVTKEITEYGQEIHNMFSTFFKYENYIKLDYEKDTLIAQDGFHFLNSNKFLDFVEKKDAMERDIIESEIQKDRLLNTYKIFRAEQYDKRENAMLQNIYDYSKDNQYNQAVFLIGADHKKGIMRKIAEQKKLSGIELNWTMYSN